MNANTVGKPSVRGRGGLTINAVPDIPRSQRLFVAIALPPAIRNALLSLSTPLPGVTWTRPEQLYLTLRFLGEVPDGKLESISSHLAKVRVEPFVLPVEGVGAFPVKSPPRTLWAGVGRGHPHLHQLRQRVDDALLAAGLLGLDVRTFHPHVTLARCTEQAAREVARWLRRQPDFEAPPFRVDAFDLVASELKATGAVHHLVQRFPLAK